MSGWLQGLGDPGVNAGSLVGKSWGAGGPQAGAHPPVVNSGLD